MTEYTVHTVKPEDGNQVQDFLNRAGNSLHKFRYFSSRSLDVLKNHVVTLLVKKAGVPVGYGHLDRENDITWLGTAVAETEKGRGVGRLIVDRLIAEGKRAGIRTIRLSVDNDNAPAIALYSQAGFQLLKKESSFSFYELKLS